MLAISVELLHGTIRAGSADDLAITGAGDPGDWPPSPARLFSALVAGGGTNPAGALGDGAELRVLERARPPLIYADARSDVLVSPLADRYVVVDATAQQAKDPKTLTVHEYPGRTARLVRPGSVLAPRHPRVVYVWDEAELTTDELGRIKARAHRVGYLGCADSPVRLSVGTVVPAGRPNSEWRASEDGTELVPVPYNGLLDDLNELFERWSAGDPVRRAWKPPERARYAPPGVVAAAVQALTSRVWLRFPRSVPGRLSRFVGEALKAAVLSLYDEHVGEPPRLLHGHGFDGQVGYQLALWAALADVGHAHARGSLHGAVVVMPEGTPPAVVEGVRTALWHLRELRLQGGRRIAVAPYAGERQPWAAMPDRWQGPSRRWASVTPVVHERRTRGEPGFEEVKRWCEHAGFPPPAACQVSAVSMLAGSPHLGPYEVYGSATSHRAFSHLELIFDESVLGPMVLGRARQFGIGMMAPLDARRRA
jgi:CRISPR-associated protein Csb2